MEHYEKSSIRSPCSNKYIPCHRTMFINNYNIRTKIKGIAIIKCYKER